MKQWLSAFALLFSLSMGLNMVLAADAGTKDEAVAMVKKAIEFIESTGTEKAFMEFNDPDGRFVDRDLYIVVYNMQGKCLAHGANPRMLNRDLIEAKDTEGKEFVKERVEMMKTRKSAWQDYKYRNPLTNNIEPKSAYFERYEDLIIGCGVYREE